MDEEYENQMERIGGDSIGPDGCPPSARRGRRNSSQQDGGPTRPIRSTLSTRSSQTNVPFQRHQQKEYPSSQGSQEPGTRHSRHATFSSDLQQSLTFTPERVASNEYSVVSTDATTENLNRKGFGSGLARKLPADARSRGADGRPPGPREGRRSSSQDAASLGPSRPIRKKLSRRSLQSDARSLQSDERSPQSRLRHQEADWSSSLGSQGPGIKHTRHATFASGLQHAVAVVPERVASSEYSVASTDATTETLYQKGFGLGYARDHSSDAVSIGADGRPPNRRRWLKISEHDVVTHGPTKPIRSGISTQSPRGILRHQKADRSSSQSSQGKRIGHSLPATFDSNLQHSLGVIPERVASSEYSVASTDATTGYIYQKGFGSGWGREHSADAVSIGADGRPPSRRRWRFISRQDAASHGPTKPSRTGLSTRSLQDSPRHQEAAWSSSQGAQRPGIRHSHPAAFASDLQDSLAFIPEGMASSMGTQASTDPIIETLKQKGFSSGLARELAANATTFANRIWVVDNSGSMIITDGHRIVPTSHGNMTETQVSRWDELQDTILYHAEMAGTLNSPTVFRLLNDPGRQVGPQELSVAQDPPGVGNIKQDIMRIRTVIQRAQPTGVTPLTSHIIQIQQALHRMAPRLRREGKRVAVILATDGLPTDEEGFGGDEITQEFVQALESLKGLPIWLVIRLCTDETNVTDFYNSLDGKFELSLEVLDDFFGEAQEVHRHNKWLNYSMPLHRCRELGYHDRLFDLIDERPLTRSELRKFCGLLCGFEVSQIPDPNTDWKAFVTFVQTSVALEPQQYSPIKKKVLPLINIRALNKVYGHGVCTVM